MSDITVHRAYVEQSNYLLYYTSVVSGIIKNGLNPKVVKPGSLQTSAVISYYNLQIGSYTSYQPIVRFKVKQFNY